MSLPALQTLRFSLGDRFRRLIGRRLPAPLPVETRSRRPSSSANGYAQGVRHPVKRIVITVDFTTFDHIRALAEAQRVSFAQAARNVIERGLQ
jgi:hypothetical protein